MKAKNHVTSFVLKRFISRAVAAFGALWLTLFPLAIYAAPQHGIVAAGQATISQNGTKLDVVQSSNKAVIDWRSFNIEAGEHTQFHQPSAVSGTINRVSGLETPKLIGKLSANGQVIVVTPNNVFYSQKTKVDVAGIVATTTNLKNRDSVVGKLPKRLGKLNAKSVKRGEVTVKEAGLAGFVAPFVDKDSTINAKLGKVALASGNSFTVDMAGDNLIEVAVTDDLQRQIANTPGKGGTVTMTAEAARQVVNGVVSHRGIVNANRFKQQDGKIILYAEHHPMIADKGKATGARLAFNNGPRTATGYNGGAIKMVAHAGSRSVSNGYRDMAGKTGGKLTSGGKYLALAMISPAKRTVIISKPGIIASAQKQTMIVDKSKKTGVRIMTGYTGGAIKMVAHAGSRSGSRMQMSGKTGSKLASGRSYQAKTMAMSARRSIIPSKLATNAKANHKIGGAKVMAWAKDHTDVVGSISHMAGQAKLQLQMELLLS